MPVSFYPARRHPLMVDRVDPKLGESIMDPPAAPAASSPARRSRKKQLREERGRSPDAATADPRRGEKAASSLLATTKCWLHGIEVPVQIRHDNTLNKPLSSWDEQLDVIVTNPPFGGTEEDGIEKNFPAEMQTRETRICSATDYKCWRKGRAAVVLPDGTLFGEGVKTKIKKLLTEECTAHIVRLPNGVFNPYTGIKTNLLFFTKGQPTKDIWFYEHPYPAGVKNYSKTKADEV